MTVVFLCLMTISGFFLNRAIADNDKTKTVAYEAKHKAEDALIANEQVSAQVADVRGAQETFRKEYREDQIENRKVLQELLLASKK